MQQSKNWFKVSRWQEMATSLEWSARRATDLAVFWSCLMRVASRQTTRWPNSFVHTRHMRAGCWGGRKRLAKVDYEHRNVVGRVAQARLGNEALGDDACLGDASTTWRVRGCSRRCCSCTCSTRVLHASICGNRRRHVPTTTERRQTAPHYASGFLC